MTLPGHKQPPSARGATEHDRRMGERIRILRREQGLSQTDLGEAVGVTFQQMQKYEKGSNRISGGRLIRIAEVLKVEPAYLLDGAAKPVKMRDTVIERMLADHHGHKLAAAFISIEDRAAASAIAVFIEGYARSLQQVAKKGRR